MSSRRRIEDERLILGRGTYVADLIPEGALHCGYVRSPVAHGTLVGVDLDEVRNAPGVVAAFAADDLDLPDIPGNTGRGPAAEPMIRPPLARGRVRYVGEPIAVVVAESASQAADAVDLAWVDVEELPAVTVAGDDHVLLFDDTDSNVLDEVFIERGDGLEAPADVSVTVEVHHQRLAPVSMETMGLLAIPGDGEMRVWCGHQAAHRLKAHLTKFAGIDGVRVMTPDTGGAFGMKGALYPEYLITAAVAQRLERPAVWLQRRPDQFTGGTHGRGALHRLTLEGTADGRILRAVFDNVADAGAYPHNGSAVPMFGRLVATGMYDIPRVEIHARVAVTNQAPTGPYRGAGRPEAALTIERGIDAFARAAGLEPLEVRKLNAVREFPYETATKARYDSGDYVQAIDTAAAMFDWETLRADQAARLAEGGPLLGVGIGAFVERAGGAIDSWEFGAVDVDADAQEIVVRTGSVDQGQGHKTVWGDLAKSIFGVESVRVVAGDTALIPASIGTFASRSAQIGASAVHRTAHAVLDEARQRAASRLEAAPEDIVYDAGVFSVAGSPGSDVSLWELAAVEPLGAEEQYSPNAQTFPYGVHAAVVEVVVETGEVRVVDIAAVDDCGNVLNGMIVEGQLHGSMAQGLGQALYEEFLYDEDGQPLSASLVSYLTPDSTVLPAIRSTRLCHPAPSNPLGVKGSGEAGCIGLPPAILNATLDALAPLGVTDLQLPLRPQKVWVAIQAAQGSG